MSFSFGLAKEREPEPPVWRDLPTARTLIHAQAYKGLRGGYQMARQFDKQRDGHVRFVRRALHYSSEE